VAVVKYKSCSADFCLFILHTRLIYFVACTAAPSSAKLIQNRMWWKNSPQTGYAGSLEGRNGNRLMSPSQHWKNGMTFRQTKSMFTSRKIWLNFLVAGGNTLVRVPVASGLFSPQVAVFYFHNFSLPLFAHIYMFIPLHLCHSVNIYSNWLRQQFCKLSLYMGARGGVVVKALRYKPAGRGFDSRQCHWNFSMI
jgi:hypothetical protein